MFEYHHGTGEDMLAAVAAGVSHPAVAALLGLGAVALAGLVVAMAWDVNARQIRLNEQLARRQFIVTGETGAANGTANGAASSAANSAANGAVAGGRGHGAALQEAAAGGAVAAPPVAIEGPETVVTGEQARYRLRPSGDHQVVSWAVGGGSVSQAPDPSHPDELLLIADRPGNLTIIVRVREGMAERRATKPVTAVADVTDPEPPFTLRLFLQGWGLVAVAVLIVGFAGALDALGSFTTSDFIALAVPLAALLGVVAVARGTGDTTGRPGKGKGGAGPRL
jgi:hypothetical protein